MQKIQGINLADLDLTWLNEFPPPLMLYIYIEIKILLYQYLKQNNKI